MSRKTSPKELYCLLGHPVAHSLSPFIMNRAFAAEGIDAAYIPMDVPPGQLPGAIAALRARPIHGANVTYPHKTAVLSLIDEASPATRVIGAANTLALAEEKLLAHNTDAVGTVRALESIGGIDVAGQHVAILGAGGAARAAAYGLLEAGAARVCLMVRDSGSERPQVAELSRAFEPGAVSVVAMTDPAVVKRTVADATIIINATPVGMADGEQGALLDGHSLGPEHCCFEFVYHPLMTKFLSDADERGALVVNGLALLVAQAQASFELWTGHSFSLGDMFDAVSSELKRTESD